MSNKNRSKVSVIIPLYNQKQYVGEAIESILNQSYPNIEIIVVNDGSTDNPFSVLEKYKKNIILINQENKGLAAAKNLLKHTPFYPTHMGSYIRNLYFWKYISKLPVKNFTKVLDAGCGSGEYALKMAQSFPWIDVIAMDIKRQNFQSNYPPNFLFKRGDLLELEERHNYDFIYSIDVLEHIPNNIKVLRNSYQALKHGGYLFLHMPYDIDKKSIFPDKFFAKFNVWAEKEYIGEQYTLDEIKSILQKIGFEIVEIEYTFGFPGELA